MKMIRLVLVGVVVSLFNGCAFLPDNTYTTTEGCGITQWQKEWVQSNVESMSWTGPCKDGRAEGKGTHIVKLKNGKQIQYVGWMYGGSIYGEGAYTRDTGWKYVGNFQNAKLKQGRVYIADGRLLFEGSMANDVQYNGKNLTYDDWRYHTGKLYYPDGSYIDDALFTGAAGVYEGISSIDPKTGKGIVYGKYVKDGEVVNRYVEGRCYDDDPAYEQAKARYNENLRVIQAAAAAKKKAEDEAAYKAMVERRERRNREGLAMLGNAATAAAGGRNVTERRQLAIQSFSQPASEPAAKGSSSSIVPGDNDCRCIEVYVRNDTEFLKNVCDYEVVAPYCFIGGSKSSSCGTDKPGTNGGGYGGAIDARGSPNRQRYFNLDTLPIYTLWHNTHYPDDPGYMQPPHRVPWSYAAISKKKYDALMKSPEESSDPMVWNKVKRLGWVCSENRQPAKSPPGKTDQDVRVP